MLNSDVNSLSAANMMSILQPLSWSQISDGEYHFSFQIPILTLETTFFVSVLVSSFRLPNLHQKNFPLCPEENL